MLFGSERVASVLFLVLISGKLLMIQMMLAIMMMTASSVLVASKKKKKDSPMPVQSDSGCFDRF